MEERQRSGICITCPKEAEIARMAAHQESSEERLSLMYDSHASLLRKLDELIPAVARLEVKAGVWGAVGGLLATLAAIALAFAVRLG